METLDNKQETAPAAPKATKQKDAVRTFITEALASAGPADATAAKARMTKEIRKVVRQRLFAGMRDGSIVLGSAMDDSKLKKYCSSLINNWLKKDAQLN
jgi:hypothetical protein